MDDGRRTDGQHGASRVRRRHPARRARRIAAGVSATALVGIVAALDAAGPPAHAAKPTAIDPGVTAVPPTEPAGPATSTTIDRRLFPGDPGMSVPGRGTGRAPRPGSRTTPPTPVTRTQGS